MVSQSALRFSAKDRPRSNRDLRKSRWSNACGRQILEAVRSAGSSGGRPAGGRRGALSAVLQPDPAASRCAGRRRWPRCCRSCTCGPVDGRLPRGAAGTARPDSAGDKLPKRLQASAKEALHEILGAATCDDAEQGIDAFAAEYGTKYLKAADSLTRDQDELLIFFDFPAEHWKSLRTTNVVESPFATVRLRQRVTKGNGSRTKGLTMAYKLLDMAEQRWRRLNGAALLPLVRAEAPFKDGKLIERNEIVETEGERAA